MKYVGTYSNPKDIVTKEKLDAVVSRVSTNEDNIAMAESDIEGLQTTVGTLQTNVNNVQIALTSKQDTVVGGASTITEDNLTTSRALISDSSGKVAVSDITSTELGYLDGVTSNVQAQLNSKQPTITVDGIVQGDGAGNLSAVETVNTDLLDLNPAAVGLGNVDNVKQYSATNPPPYPVTSVNGHTGAITVHEVPVVTTADNGKSAVVVNGAWVAVDKTPFYVNCTVSGSNIYDETVTHDKTYAQILAAHQAGRPCYAVVDSSDNAKIYLPLTKLMEGDDAMATFSLAQMMTGDAPEELQVFYVSISPNYAEGFWGTRYTATTANQFLPSVTASDNGKFLRVVNGVWTAVEIANANGGSF